MSGHVRPPNLLAFGDNLDVLRRHVKEESVDLVYLDPPFSSNADYNILFQERGVRAAAQIKAFGDTWAWDTAAASAYQEIVEGGGDVAKTLRAFRAMLGTSDLLAYLSMMTPRLIELRRVLKPTGSLYLHCDPTASHYLKLLLDAVLGPENFQNEVIWAYRTGGVSKRRWARKHDVLLFYSRSKKFKFHPLQERIYYDRPFFTDKKDEEGRYYADVYMRDVWDIPAVINVSKERLGYPTQKPLALLERIVAASTDRGDIVLDPFCGCGTAIAAAQQLARHWIGIDITHHAIGLIKHRLAVAHGPSIAESYGDVIGEPTTKEDAAVLARDDPYQFQSWALGLVGARPAGPTKKGGDKGIDGRTYFHDVIGGPSREVVISVKAGHLVPAYVRDLVGVIDREEADVGVLISFEEPTAGMRAEAASSGFYEVRGVRYPRIQLRTVSELLDGHAISLPVAAEPPVTLWPPDTIPTAPPPRKRPATATPLRPSIPTAAATPEAEEAQRLREEYARRVSELAQEYGQPLPSPEAPLSPRTSTRDR